jgi:hypothetical protein
MQPPNSPPPRPPDSRVSGTQPTADRQLAQLFGESLFGAWLDPVELLASGHRERKRGRWGKRLGILLLGVLLVGAGVWVTRQGLGRRAEQERAHVAKDVAAFLAEGELDRLAQFLALLSPPGPSLQAADPYLDLIVSAEAALYRYQDAAPARLARILPFLAAPDATPGRRLARLTVGARAERAAAYDQLTPLLGAHARDPEYRTLMATAEEQRRDIPSARQSWERSLEAGPLWLPHRYQQAAFEARHRHADRLGRITQHMVRVAPESPWTRLAIKQFGGRAPSPPATAAPRPPSAVTQHHEQLGLVFVSLAAGDSRSARQALERALAAVNNQTPFVLDAFDQLVEARARELALEMATFEAWPRGDRQARERLDELRRSALRPEPPAAVPQAEPAARAKPGDHRPSEAKQAEPGRTSKKKAAGKKPGGRKRR